MGLTPSHGYLLFAISKDPDQSQKELSDLLGFDQSTMTRFVQALVTQGLIKKSAKGKGASLSPTPQGKKMFKKVSRLMDSLCERMQKRIGKKRFLDFVGELQGLRHLFQNGEQDD